MRIPTFASLRAFEATARFKSVRRAAAELCVDHASVTRHIAALQRDLGVPIMKSSPTGIELTDVGEAYAQRMDRVPTRGVRVVSSGLVGLVLS